MLLTTFMGGTDVQRSLNMSDSKCINLYPTSNDNQQITGFIATPGLSNYATIPGNVQASGIYTASNGRCFMTAGTILYEITTGGTLTSRGTITAGTICRMTDNGIELIIVNGVDGWLLTFSTNALAKIKVFRDTFTASTGTPCVITTTAAHPFVAGDSFIFSSTGVLPAGLDVNVVYYVLASGLGTNTMQISTVAGGTAINTTGESGTHQVTRSAYLQDVLISIGTPAQFTTTTAHNLNAGDQVVLFTTGALPTGLTASSVTYYVIATNLSVTGFELSATLGGAAIATSGTQSGTQSFNLIGLTYDITSISTANPALFTTTTAHALSIGDVVSFTTTGALPIQVSTTAYYYVVAGGFTTTTFEISTTKGGTALSTAPGTNTLTSVGYGFPEGTKTITYANGRFVCVEPASQAFWVSDPLKGGTWDPLNVQTADSNPDLIIGTIAQHNELIIFCEQSGEAYYDSGTYPTPFVRNISGVFEVGCIAPYSIAKIDNSVMWLGRSSTGYGIVYRLNGYTPQRMSTYSIEYAIQQMGDVSDAISFTYQQDGHHFYVINFPTGGKTFCFDINTQLWHERAGFLDGVFTRWEAQEYAYFDGKHLVCDKLEGKIYSLSLDVFTDGGATRKWVRSFRAPSSDMKRANHHKLTLEVEGGVGTVGGTDQSIALRISNDGGHTWSSEFWRDLGAMGQYAKRVFWHRLGMTSSQPRIYELSGTADVKTVLINCYLE